MTIVIFMYNISLLDLSISDCIVMIALDQILLIIIEMRIEMC